jgi:PAS domain S-box-containing protein
VNHADGAAVVLVDTEGTIRYLSQAMADLIGHSPEEVLGHSLDLLVPPDYRQRHWAGFRSVMASGTAALEGMAASIPVLCADGEVRRWPGRFTVVRDPRGKPVGAAATLAPPEENDPPWFEL